MKRVTTYTLVLILTISFFTSCNSSDKRSAEQIAMEEYVLSRLKSPTSYQFVSFVKENDITLGDEFNDRIEFFENACSGYFASKRDSIILQLLTNEKEELGDKLSDITFVTYQLAYDAQNPMGAMLRGNCIGRFNAAGEMVGIKMDDENWQEFGNHFSIPNYYDWIEKY